MLSYAVLAAITAFLPRLTGSDVTGSDDIPCGGSPPGGIEPGVPISHLNEPLPGPHACLSSDFEPVQEYIWVCKTLQCCSEPCDCEAGHHSQNGCGALDTLAELRCYVTQNAALRWHRRVCCDGYQEDDTGNCVLPPTTPPTTTQATTTTTTQATTTTTTQATTTTSRATTTTTRRTTTTTTQATTTTLKLTPAAEPINLPAIKTTTPEPATTIPVVVATDAFGRGGDPPVGPVHHHADSAPLSLIAGIVGALLLLILLLLLAWLGYRRIKRKMPAAEGDSHDAAFTNQTYGILAAQAAAPEPELLLPDKKLPVEDACYDNIGADLHRARPDLPPPYTEKPAEAGAMGPECTGPDPEYFNEKVPLGAPVVSAYTPVKCGLTEVSTSPVRYVKHDDALTGMYSQPQSRGMLGDVREVRVDMSRDSEADQQNDINENIYCVIKDTQGLK